MGLGATLAMVGKPSRRLADQRAKVKLESIFPVKMGEWQPDQRAAPFVRPAPEDGKYYGVYDQVLERIFINPQGQQVMLSVAYGADQSVALQLHRPEGCYVGAGFEVSQVHPLELKVEGRTLPVKRLLATRPGRSEPITYWTLLGDEVENDVRSFSRRQMYYSLRGQILDGMLVRVSSFDNDPKRAWEIQAGFVDTLVKALAPADRPRVVGMAPATRSS